MACFGGGKLQNINKIKQMLFFVKKYFQILIGSKNPAIWHNRIQVENAGCLFSERIILLVADGLKPYVLCLLARNGEGEVSEP